MEPIRKPFQGVTNIVRFNWHFYAWSIAFVLAIFIGSRYVGSWYRALFVILALLGLAPMLVSLLVSVYVYDLSKLYSLNWLDGLHIHQGGTIVNINAGFDETSVLLNSKYPDAGLHVYDFYDPVKHTEVSIERARKAYPAWPGTVAITTAKIPLEQNLADTIFVIFAAHEIRNDAERVFFFKELNRVLKPSGKIIVTEHLRDLPNFMAYNIGFLHFHPRATWHTTFENASFKIENEIKITPFISTFILSKNGTAH